MGKYTMGERGFQDINGLVCVRGSCPGFCVVGRAGARTTRPLSRQFQSPARDSVLLDYSAATFGEAVNNQFQSPARGKDSGSAFRNHLGTTSEPLLNGGVSERNQVMTWFRFV